MLHPNNACLKDLILSLCQRRKKSSIRRQWLPAKDCRSCKKNWQTTSTLLFVRQKSTP